MVEKKSLFFQHSNSPLSTSPSNEERSPKLPHNNGAVSTTPSGSTEPMRNRNQTTAAPVLPKRSYNMMPPSPNPTLDMLDKKRLMSDSPTYQNSCQLNPYIMKDEIMRKIILINIHTCGNVTFIKHTFYCNF